jgi:hypothetical protein
MSGRDIDRAYYLKQLFDQQYSKTDHSKDHKGRLEEAATLMDKLTGPEWRIEVSLPGIDIVAEEVVSAPHKPEVDKRECLKKGIERFYENASKQRDEAGLGTKDTGTIEDPEERKKLKSKVAKAWQSMKNN